MESDVSILIGKVWTVVDRLLTIVKFNPFYKIKLEIFLAITM